MQSERHKCDLGKIKVQALPERLNMQHRGEIKKMYFRELDGQMMTLRGEQRECRSWCEGESFICAAKRWQRKGMA